MGVVLEYKAPPQELPLPCNTPRVSTDRGNRSPRSALATARNALLVVVIVLLFSWLLVSMFSKDGRLFELHFSVTVAGRRGMNFDMDVHNKGGGAGRSISDAPRAAWDAARSYWSSVNHGVHSA